MAAVVYGGSPRHHQTRIINPNGSTSNLPQHSAGSGNPGNIIVPPLPYLSSPVSLHHYSHHSGGGGVSSASPTHPQHHYQGTAFYPVSHSNANQMPNPLYASQRNFKRKSAVELLAESKSYYVKSETVLDRHQHLYRSGNMGSAPCEYQMHCF